MSSPYPVRGNKLDLVQWKVTELKEELRRRRLKTSGLKDELVRRLEEAIRIEREDEELRKELANVAEVVEDVNNGVDLENLHVAGVKNAEAASVAIETVEVVVDAAGNRDEKLDDVMVQVDIDESVKAMSPRELQEEVKMGGVNSSRVEEEELTVHATTVETSISVIESVVSEVALSAQDVQNSGTQEANENSSIQLENEDSKPQLENESSKPPEENVELEFSAPDNQVSEVNPNLGFQVKSDSISTDSVSINEKIELKDIIIADDVKLVLDDVKLEMVEPSSSNVVPVGGESHPMDIEEPQEKSPSVEKKDDSNGTNADLSKKNDSFDVGYSEKLNLDRSSGDDSMEEDVLASKQIDSKYNTDEVGDRGKIKNEVPSVKEENLVNVTGKDLSTDQKEIHVENKICPVAPMEKRKLDDQEAVGNTEPLKRQRKWNSESIKIPEQRSSNLTPTSTPKDGFQLTPSRRNFSRSDSSVSEEAPKERIVPPSQKPPTNSLRIDCFLRPFTLKAVQELLGKTGSVTSFWMDHIKTHCYVTYSTVEEAVGTRNTVYNLQWPPNGGRLLVAEFVDPQEVKIRVDAPPQSPAALVSPSAVAPAPAPPMLQPQPSPRQQVSRQQLPLPASLPPPPPLSNPPHARERVDLPPPPPLPEKHDPPIVTLDDLFRKTKTTPRIYYLPLSEEQVAAKLAGRGKNTKQSAGVASRKELFRPSRGMWFVAGFGFSEDCMVLKLKFFLALETFELRTLYMSGSLNMWTYLVFLLNKNFNFPNLKQLVLNSLRRCFLSGPLSRFLKLVYK
uniref:SAP domain-containing protein n=1 Tax=Salix viminalis TaxID=40686 RepID=A0A6N2LY53_SALVM